MFAAGKTKGVVATAANYIEDVFSTYLYKGNNSTLSINNGIDVSGKGGLVWIKNRQQAGYYHTLVDTVRGPSNQIYSNATDAQYTATGLDVTAFTSTGFTLGPDNFCNQGNANNVSWTFRKQPKFFDVVTFTTASDGSATVSHALGSTPAFVIVKRTDSTGLWFCWHTSLPSTNYYLFLNTTSAQTNSGGTWLTPSNTQVSFPSNSSTGALDSSANYVMYVYASNAGGFGLTGTDNVISCGSYTGNGGNQDISLGYEAQWVMIKRTDTSSQADWVIFDTMRGMTVPNGDDNYLFANSAAAEGVAGFPGWISPTATGFRLDDSQGRTNASGSTYIYIAIRRGPMKVPTDGTKVFALDTLGGTSPNPPGFNAGFPVDLGFFKYKAGTSDWSLGDRLRGAQELYTNLTNAEVARADFKFDYQDGWFNSTGVSTAIQSYNFQRAPSFFDEVCYTGTGTTSRNNSHNLAAVPELMIVKERNFGGTNWRVYSSALGNTKEVYLNQTNASTTTTSWASTTPTASVFTVGVSGGAGPNDSGSTYIAYLFATCAGVSKCTAFTGTGTLQTINCGFTSGARFVLIKRTDSTGDWYVWDSSRGLSSSTDPYLLLNSTAAEVTSTNWVDTTSTGFQVTAASGNNVNINGASYIALAIA